MSENYTPSICFEQFASPLGHALALRALVAAICRVRAGSSALPL
jgi:hypothetical protein